MRISTRGRYGLRAMVDMARHAEKDPIALREIAERQGVSESYLEQVYAALRKAGLVTAQRGAQGGYGLARPADKITPGDILRALEGPIAPVHCVDLPASESCGRMGYCTTRPFWEELRDRINTFLDGVTLQDLADRARETGREQMYYI